ncbi:hypothetical protein [Bdellovibrio sp. HCB2-146]|uniref:hypothetical protein n=1 Tax=Bdellovibrio sp. HCB2-146 TaxID=3394362 RepID=UPI0039BC4FA3
MKSILAAAVLLASAQSYAGPECNVAYAASRSHLFKGMSRPVGDKEILKAGEVSKDEFYTVALSKKGVLTLKETQTGKPVELKSGNYDVFTLWSTESLKGQVYPDGIPGAFTGRQFILAVCVEEGFQN